MRKNDATSSPPSPIPERPNPVFLGYVLKQTLKLHQTRPPADSAVPAPDPAAWFKGTLVEEVCSVSNCMSPIAEHGRYDRWAFNPSGFYHHPDDARRDLDPAEDASTFELFAFELYLLEFHPGSSREVSVRHVFDCDPADLPESGPSPEAGEFSFLGFDVVAIRPAAPRTDTSAPRIVAFEHSPLSCNGVAPEHPVNRHCLIESWPDAALAAQAIAAEQPEPGVYYIVGVFRSQC